MLLTTDQLAERLQVGRATLYAGFIVDLMACGLKEIRYGRCVRYLESSLEPALLRLANKKPVKPANDLPLVTIGQGDTARNIMPSEV